MKIVCAIGFGGLTEMYWACQYLSIDLYTAGSWRILISVCYLHIAEYLLVEVLDYSVFLVLRCGMVHDKLAYIFIFRLFLWEQLIEYSYGSYKM